MASITIQVPVRITMLCRFRRSTRDQTIFVEETVPIEVPSVEPHEAPHAFDAVWRNGAWTGRRRYRVFGHQLVSEAWPLQELMDWTAPLDDVPMDDGAERVRDLQLVLSSVGLVEQNLFRGETTPWAAARPSQCHAALPLTVSTILSHERETVTAEIQRRMADFVVIGGEVWRRIAEPRILLHWTPKSSRKASLSVFVPKPWLPSLDAPFVFSVAQVEEALTLAQEITGMRTDSPSLLIKGDTSVIGNGATIQSCSGLTTLLMEVAGDALHRLSSDQIQDLADLKSVEQDIQREVLPPSAMIPALDRISSWAVGGSALVARFGRRALELTAQQAPGPSRSDLDHIGL